MLYKRTRHPLSILIDGGFLFLQKWVFRSVQCLTLRLLALSTCSIFEGLLVCSHAAETPQQEPSFITYSRCHAIELLGASSGYRPAQEPVLTLLCQLFRGQAAAFRKSFGISSYRPLPTVLSDFSHSTLYMHELHVRQRLTLYLQLCRPTFFYFSVARSSSTGSMAGNHRLRGRSLGVFLREFTNQNLGKPADPFF